MMPQQPAPIDRKKLPRKTSARVKKIKIIKPKIKADRRSYLLHRCPICLDNLRATSAVSTTCGHVFCRSCLKRAIDTSISQICPFCRKKMWYHNLYLDNNYDECQR